MRHFFASALVVLVSLTAGTALAGKGGGVKPPPPGKSVNACGCYKDDAGQCFCPKKGKCICPGDCEPVGCEAKRQKEMEKAMAEELKKAAEADKKQKEAEASGKAGGDDKGDKGKADKGKDDKAAGKKKDEAPPSDMPALEKKGKKK